jgi:hypothetical protein
MVLLSFWSQKFLKARTAAHKTLRELSSHKGPNFLVDWKTGFSRRQRNDLMWRAELFGKVEPDHWELLEADFPSVLDQPFLGQHTPLDPRTTMATRDEEQALNMHKDFKGAILMTNDLRAFHRNDGTCLKIYHPTLVLSDLFGQVSLSPSPVRAASDTWVKTSTTASKGHPSH